MSDRRVKPCATCGHGKTLHRVGYCLHVTERHSQTYFGFGKCVVYCRCPGYKAFGVQP